MHNPTLAKIKGRYFNIIKPPSWIGLPCDRAFNSNITADHFYSVRA